MRRWEVCWRVEGSMALHCVLVIARTWNEAAAAAALAEVVANRFHAVEDVPMPHVIRRLA
jgi:hypothetical protein